MIAPVNKIIDQSFVDGPGNRTAIFFQGCNFKCEYCHNPETIHMCNHCGTCLSACPTGALSVIEGKVTWNKEICCGCDTCIHTCPNMSSPKITYMSVDEVLEKIKSNIPFIKGITCSGGECTLRAEFMQELFVKTETLGLNNLIDSNGTYDFEAHPEMLEHCEGVMLDVKCVESERHKTLTGQLPDMVLRNTEYLASIGKLTEIRTVVIDGELPNRETVTRITERLGKYLDRGNIRYKLIKYRSIGVREPYNKYKTPSDELMQELKMIAELNGFKNILIV